MQSRDISLLQTNSLFTEICTVCYILQTISIQMQIGENKSTFAVYSLPLKRQKLVFSLSFIFMMLFSLYLNGIIFARWFLSAFKGMPWQNPFTQVKTGVIDFFMFINALLFASVVAYGVYCKLILLYSGQQFNAGNYQKKINQI